MPRGDPHNRKRKYTRIKERISNSDKIPEHNKQFLFELDQFNINVSEVGIDRRVRNLEAWYQLAEHIGDDWSLNKPSKKRIDQLIGDITQGKVTETNKPSAGQVNEFKKALNKAYHARQPNDTCLLKNKDPNYDGSNIATFTYTSRNRSIDPETVLKPEDVGKLLNSAERPRDKCYIIILWATAARVGEALGMKWKDINLTRVQGNRMAEIVVRDLKYSAEDEKTVTRKVPIREGYTFIKEYKKADPISDNPEAYLFRRIGSLDPKDQLSHSGASNIISRALDKIRNSSEIEWNEARKTNNHNFRHSRATYWSARGMTEAQIRKLGGWSDSSDTVKHYIHLGREDVEGAVLDFHGLEKKEEEEDFTLEPIPCPRCQTLNPFNAETCSKPGCDEALKMTDKAEKMWIEETTKEVAFSVANSNTGISQEEIKSTAEKLLQEKMRTEGSA